MTCVQNAICQDVCFTTSLFSLLGPLALLHTSLLAKVGRGLYKTDRIDSVACSIQLKSSFIGQNLSGEELSEILYGG